MINKNEIVNRIKSKMKKKIDKLPKKHIKYQIGDLIYKRNISPDKVDKKWNGPFRIVKLSKNNGNVYIKIRDKLTKISKKNIRPIKRGENVVSTYHTCDDQNQCSN
ncbi:hypothetical protein DMUE_4275 [Dictyocoela muelleri]|nr:hypothetical protein DMUE_4275 [Dictyocoela muelleri]